MNKPHRGVSLIEMAITLAIIALLYAISAPSFTTWIGNVQIRTATESIQNGLQLARAEAIRRNSPVMFWLTSQTAPQAGDWLVGCSNPAGGGTLPEVAGDCPGVSTQNALPAAGPPYNWIQRQNAADQQTALPTVTTLPANANVVTFNSLGMITTNIDGTAPMNEIDVTLATGTVRPLRITLGGGQIRMCDPALAVANDARGC
jgi:type IV fimbrial biogenesis protein FimT